MRRNNIKTNQKTKKKVSGVITDESGNAENLPVADPKDDKKRKPVPIETILYYQKKGLGVTEISKLTDRTPATISRRLQDVKDLENFRNYKDSALEELQLKLLTHVTDDKLKSSSAGTLITGAAIVQDKIRVIREQPTQVIEFKELQCNLNTLLDQLLQLRQGETQPTPLPYDVIECNDIT